MVSRRMISIMTPLLRLLRGEGKQRDVPRLHDCIGQAALMRRTDSGNSPGHDLGALGDQLREQFDVLVIDGIDAFHTELTNFLAPVILFLNGQFDLLSMPFSWAYC